MNLIHNHTVLAKFAAFRNGCSPDDVTSMHIGNSYPPHRVQMGMVINRPHGLYKIRNEWNSGFYGEFDCDVFNTWALSNRWDRRELLKSDNLVGPFAHNASDDIVHYYFIWRLKQAGPACGLKALIEIPWQDIEDTVTCIGQQEFTTYA